MRAEIHAIDPAQPVYHIKTLDRLVGDSMLPRSTSAALMMLFSALALLLAAVGVYGVVAYGVSQQTREFGLRIALGATPRDLLTLVLRRGLVMVGAGIALGVAGALGRLAPDGARALRRQPGRPSDLRYGRRASRCDRSRGVQRAGVARVDHPTGDGVTSGLSKRAVTSSKFKVQNTRGLQNAARSASAFRTSRVLRVLNFELVTCNFLSNHRRRSPVSTLPCRIAPSSMVNRGAVMSPSTIAEPRSTTLA